MMKKKNGDKSDRRSGLTRRQVLAGAAAAALATAAPAAFAAPKRLKRLKRQRWQRLAPGSPIIRRYMAASAALGDGRILVTGGYDRPWNGSKPPMPLRSAVIYNPSTGQWAEAAPLGVPRARHAMVALSDGRAAVIGGLGMSATASVEVYDPASNVWIAAKPLSQPRFDHNAVTDGRDIYVIGGSAQTMLSGIEILTLEVQSALADQ